MADLFERARRALNPHLAEIQAALAAADQQAPIEEAPEVAAPLLNFAIPEVEGGEDQAPLPEEISPQPMVDDTEPVQELPGTDRTPARADADVMRWYASQMASKRASSPLKFKVTPSALEVALNLGHGSRQDALTRQTGESAAPVIQNFWAPYVRELLQKAGNPSPETLRLIEDQMYDAFSSPSQYYGKPSGREIA